MGQAISCSSNQQNGFFNFVQTGELDAVKRMLEKDPSLLKHTADPDRQSALHLAASKGQIEVLTVLLERSKDPDVLNRHKQTPLMLAAMYGKISCLNKLIDEGANILKFDSLHGRTCLHYAAYNGHYHCLQAILSAAESSSIAVSWGHPRFVNIRDDRGATPLHLASRQGWSECVHILLHNGALVCSSTGGFGYPGNTPLHLAARGGSLGCIRELLAWGADRLQRDKSGRIPYLVALKFKHGDCAALLNPSSAEPLIWPSPLKFISELNGEAKALLENALMEANREREKNILKGITESHSSRSHSDSDVEDKVPSEADLCSICFDQACTIQVEECGHQMCASCMLSLCCHNKPNPTTATMMPPVCPFCRSSITRLTVAKPSDPNHMKRDNGDVSSPRLAMIGRPQPFLEASSSFKELSAIGSFGRMDRRGSGRILCENNWTDKSRYC